MIYDLHLYYDYYLRLPTKLQQPHFCMEMILFLLGNLAPSITEEQLTDVMIQFGEHFVINFGTVVFGFLT